MWAMAFFKDIKNNLDAIQETADPKKQKDFTKKLFGAIQYHSVGMELSKV